MRTAAALLLVLALASCDNTRRCREGTILLSVTLSGAAVTANLLRVSLVVDGGGQRDAGFKARSPQGTIEIDFPAGYPAGSAAAITVAAERDGLLLGSNTLSEPMTPGCSAFAIEVSDLPIPPPDLAVTPRDMAVLGCAAFLDCLQGCLSDSCYSNCFNSASTTAQMLYQNVNDCIEVVCPTNTGDVCDPNGRTQADCQRCVNGALGRGGACASHYEACLNN